MAVNLEYYKYFYFVAKYKNMTKAAEALYSNQPNVTRIMNNLEHELGCRLLERNNRGITLTQEGEQLYSHVELAFSQLQSGEKELKKILNLEKGIIYIGTSEAALHGYLVPKLVEFHKKYPNIRFKIYNYTSPEAIKALREERIDLAVIVSPKEIVAGFEKTSLKSFTDILACGNEHKELAQRKMHINELIDYPLVMIGQNSRTYVDYRQWFLENDCIMGPDIEVATTDLILPMIENNLGIGFLPYEFAKHALKDGKINQITLYENIPEREICLVMDKKRNLSTAAKELISLLKQKDEKIEKI